MLLKYNKDKKTLTSESLNKYVELKQDIFVNILEVNENSEKNVVVFGKKVTKAAEPAYVDAFSSSNFMSFDHTQIVTNFTHSRENDRKMQIKVGKITDKNILKKIKNKDATGISDLLTFAKNSEGLYNKVVDVKNNPFIEYSCAKDEDGYIDLKGKLTDEEYYFLYVQTKDENGKYVSCEGVTLAQANVYNKLNGEWYLFFYGTEKFKWADLGDAAQTGDNTTADKVLPKTGVDMIAVFTIVGIVSIATIAGIKYFKFRDIK